MLANPKIEVLCSHVVRDVLDVAEDRVTGVEVEDLEEQREARSSRCGRRCSSPSATRR